jgi:4'-phosphopantetheinyl transferase
VWRIGLDLGEREAMGLRRHLAPGELERLERLRGSEVGRRWLVSRGALREILGAEIGASPDAVRLVLGEHGRPGLDPGTHSEALDFNLSHSGELALVAVTQGMKVGVDVERLRPGRNPLRVADRFFSPAEVDALAAVDEQERPSEFLRYWTAKEALAKGLGLGLMAPRGELELQPAGDGALIPLRAPGWQLAEIEELPATYRGTLAVEGKLEHLEMRDWLPEEPAQSRP